MGGKWILAPWVIQHFPRHRVYVEPYGGAGSVLLRKRRSYSEVWNDLSGELVNLFRVLRDPEQTERLIHDLHNTLFSREEFDAAKFGHPDPVENARRLIVRSYQGFGSDSAVGQVTGFRASSNRSGTTPAHDWKHYPESLRAVSERFRGVVIENRPAIAVMTTMDSPTTLHYVDPPYVHSTRSHGNPYCKKHLYPFEMTDAQHEELGEFLKTLTGMVVVSGYNCELYERVFDGWTRRDKNTHADGARDRVESLWLNEAAANGIQASMFEGDV